MQIGLPFTVDSKVVELGGDVEHPIFRPNLSDRVGPAVDTVCDLNELFPLETESWDGVFGGFVIEHIRHAKLRQFISETYRVLKDGGAACFITANLLEQARRLVETAEWSDELIHMLFGGSPDYPGNYHHTGFSPKWAMRLFFEAGFIRVDVKPHPACATDMIIEAWK